jgi:hypothetical protein
MMDLDDRELEAQLRDALHRAAEPVHGEGIFKETIRNEVARRQDARSRARWTGRLILAGAAAAAAVALFVLVKPDDDRVDTDGGKGPIATQPEVPTTVQPNPTEPGTDPADTPVTSTTAPTTTAPSTTTAPTLPEFPPEDPLMHGKTTWGLYLVVMPAGEASVNSPEFQAALQAAEDAGYSQAEGYSGIGCDDGAAEGLGLDPADGEELISPAIYFASEDLANQARDAFEARGQSVQGIAHVTTYCLD